MYDCFNRRIDYLRVSVTDLCNLRCEYCMPPQGVPKLRHDQILSFERIVEVVRAAVEMGVRKVRLTGGEPLVRRGIVGLVEMLSDIEGIKDLSMTTNGVLLAKHAEPLRKAGLQRVNVSLDTLDPERYSRITRGGNLEDVLEGIEAARDAGLLPIKLNCVIEKSPEEPDAKEVAGFGCREGYPVRFIRRMDIRRGLFWPVIGGEGGKCAQCNRLRLTSTGLVKPCLFSDMGFSVIKLGAERALRMALENKPLSGMSSEDEMFSVGG